VPQTDDARGQKAGRRLIIDPGLLETIAQAPAGVARWVLHMPHESPRWRMETAGQREAREQFEEIGGWAGI
jgi:hypothetical protein